MIDVLEAIADATCANCNGRITQYRGSMTGTFWSHEQTRTAYCPGAPTADPLEGSVKERPCSCGAPDATSLNPAEAVVHRRDGHPCGIERRGV